MRQKGFCAKQHCKLGSFYKISVFQTLINLRFHHHKGSLIGFKSTSDQLNEIIITLALNPVALMLVTDAGDEMLWRQVRGKVTNIVF